MPMSIEERLAVLERVVQDFVKHHGEMHDSQTREVIQRAGELQRRLDEMNQFRAQINTERGEFLQRETYEEGSESMNKRVTLLELSNSNLQGRLYMVGAVISVVVSIVVVAVNLVVKLWK